MIGGATAIATERVLVVEHDVADARLVVAALSEVAPFDFEIDFATSIEQAETLLGEHRFEIVLLDIGLPGVPWTDAIDRLAELGEHAIIMIAPVQEEELALKAVAHGAQDYVLKGSLRKAELGRSIRYALERQQLMTESISREEQVRAAVEAQKMWVVGRLAASVAHEFNNLLTGLIGDAELLRRGVQHNEPYATYAQSINDGLARAALLTHQLVAFSRKKMTGPQVMDMERLVDGLLPVLQGLLGPDVEFDVTRADAEPTQFRIRLPASDPESPKPRVPSGPYDASIDPPRAHVLVVDDEEVVRRLCKRVLMEEGYAVTSAADGAEALARASQMDQLDLVVTDVVMPHLNGKELVKELKKRYPDVRTLYVSGYDRELLSVGGELGDQVAFLAKPFRLQDLLRTVRLTLAD